MYIDECLSPSPVAQNSVDTPSPADVVMRKCVVRLRNENLDALGFIPSTKSRVHSRGHLLFAHSPTKNGRQGRLYILGSDRLKLRVDQLDQNKVSKCGLVSPFRKIGYTPPKSLSRQNNPVRRKLENEMEKMTTTDTSAPAPTSVTKDPKPHSRGVYVPMIDPYMIGSTDLAEVMEFVEQIVCGKKLSDGSVCAGHLHDLRIPKGGTGGALRFKLFCNKCGKEYRWGESLTPTRGKDGRFTKRNEKEFCSMGERLMYSVCMLDSDIYHTYTCVLIHSVHMSVVCV